MNRLSNQDIEKMANAHLSKSMGGGSAGWIREAYVKGAKDVSQFYCYNQRELLFAFEKWKTNHVIGATDEWRRDNVNLFLNQLNTDGASR